MHACTRLRVVPRVTQSHVCEDHPARPPGASLLEDSDHFRLHRAVDDRAVVHSAGRGGTAGLAQRQSDANGGSECKCAACKRWYAPSPLTHMHATAAVLLLEWESTLSCTCVLILAGLGHHFHGVFRNGGGSAHHRPWLRAAPWRVPSKRLARAGHPRRHHRHHHLVRVQLQHK